ncbi:MAG: Lrp/AsnC family transcriptional regulator [Candidatus Bathyarchaeota archaeon]|nr:Lrp/AsnC family transcriptional regulator [Candidatus Bathyarchaeota archaeon]
MTRMKDVDFKILHELMRNSKRSDRDLARQIGVSQPTVTRRRARLEEEAIDDYTLVPKWRSLGYSILAITLVKTDLRTRTKERNISERERALDWLMKRPQIIMGSGCTGNGSDSFMISVHKSYGEYDDMLRELESDLGDTINNVQSILVNLEGDEVLKPLALKYLAETK